MSSKPPPQDSDSEPPQRSSPEPPRADELLPPVEPPDAKFILQLFVVPGVIVLVVVLLGWIVTALAGRGEIDPEDTVAALRSSSNTRWQEAFELANALRAEQLHPQLKYDSQLASELAKLLAEEVAAQREDDGSVKLRSFLCSALGAFHVDDGLSVLLTTAREDVDSYVRCSAIDAVAVLAEDFREQNPPHKLEDPKLVETFVALPNDPDDEVRSRTAYALGVITLAPDTDPRLMQELEILVDDLNSIARYNAALALARRGSMLSVAPLIEMLDLESLVVAVQREPSPALQSFKRNTILKNALDAVKVVAEKNPTMDRTPLVAAVEKFIEQAPAWEELGPVPEQLIDQAREVVDKLQG